jgi:hypothetical protein
LSRGNRLFGGLRTITVPVSDAPTIPSIHCHSVRHGGGAQRVAAAVGKNGHLPMLAYGMTCDPFDVSIHGEFASTIHAVGEFEDVACFGSSSDLIFSFERPARLRDLVQFVRNFPQHEITAFQIIETMEARLVPGEGVKLSGQPAVM